MRSTKAIIGTIVAATALTGGVILADGHLTSSTTDTQAVLDFADASDTGGTSVLTRTDGMVVAVVEAAGLQPHEAYTLWWVVFNQPDNCSAPGCGEDDIFVDGDPSLGLNVAGVQAAEIGIGNATGNVAKSDGTTELGGRLVRSDTSGAHQIVFPAGLAGEALLTQNPHDVEVHVIVQAHGQARGGRQLSNQISQLEYGCSPSCADVQFAVHLP